MHLFAIRPSQEAVDEEVWRYPRGQTYKYNEVIQEIGFGIYQYKIVATVAILYIGLGVFISLTSFLIPLYKTEIKINEWEVGLLISAQGAGSLTGGLVFSYFSDFSGRKSSLIAALVLVI